MLNLLFGMFATGIQPSPESGAAVFAEVGAPCKWWRKHAPLCAILEAYC